MPPEDSFLPFALTCVGICVPTYLIVLVVNNVDQVKHVLTKVQLFLTNILSCAVPEKAEKIKVKIQHQQEKRLQQEGHSLRRPMIRKAATHASLEPRLSAEMSLDPIRHATHSIMGTTRRVSQSLSHHLPSGGRRSHAVTGAAAITTPKLPTLTTQPEELEDPVARRERASTVKFEEPLYSPSLARTAESEKAIFVDAERSTTLPSMSQATTLASEQYSPAPTPTTSVAVQDFSQGTLTVPVNRSLFRRWSERLSPMQNSPRASDSGSLSPKESV